MKNYQPEKTNFTVKEGILTVKQFLLNLLGKLHGQMENEENMVYKLNPEGTFTIEANIPPQIVEAETPRSSIKNKIF